MRSRTLHWIAFFAAVLLVVVPRFAIAQTLTMNPAADVTQVPRLDPSGTTVGKRALLTPDGISYSDCASDLRIRATLAPSPVVANQNIQVWAGLGSDDCKEQTLRTGATQRCWKVAVDQATSISMQIQVRFQDLLNIPSLIKPTPAYSSSYTPASSSVCGQIDYNTVGVYFLLMSGSDVLASQQLSYVVDTIGPEGLSGVSVSAGDSRLTVSFTPSGTSVDDAGTSTSTATATSQVTVYWTPSSGKPATQIACEDASATTTTTDTDLDAASDASDAGDDAGDLDASTESTADASSAEVCTSPAEACYALELDLETGEIPADSVPHATTGQNSSSYIINDLQNGVTYAVAVAGTDPFGNVGALSTVQCGVPIALNDFWETYKLAGGGAEGCATTLLPRGSNMALFFVASVSFVSTLLRRRARKNGGEQ